MSQTREWLRKMRREDDAAYAAFRKTTLKRKFRRGSKVIDNSAPFPKAKQIARRRALARLERRQGAVQR